MEATTVTRSISTDRLLDPHDFSPQYTYAVHSLCSIFSEYLSKTRASNFKKYALPYADCIIDNGDPSRLGRKANVRIPIDLVYGEPRIDYKYNTCDRKDVNCYRQQDCYEERMRG